MTSTNLLYASALIFFAQLHFQQMDHPIPPGTVGVLNFCYGITDEMQQHYRNQILQVGKHDLINVAIK